MQAFFGNVNGVQSLLLLVPSFKTRRFFAMGIVINWYLLSSSFQARHFLVMAMVILPAATLWFAWVDRSGSAPHHPHHHHHHNHYHYHHHHNYNHKKIFRILFAIKFNIYLACIFIYMAGNIAMAGTGFFNVDLMWISLKYLAETLLGTNFHSDILVFSEHLLSFI